MTTRFKSAAPKIIAAIDKLGQNVLKRADLATLFEKSRHDWQLRQNESFSKFLTQLIDSGVVDRVQLTFEGAYPNEVRYLRGTVSAFELALSIKPRTYLTHFSALALHGLTEQVPKTVYVNFEQPPKRGAGRSLSQDAIDRAFSRPQRTTSFVTVWGTRRIMVLNGMNTGELGVVTEELTLPDIRKVRPVRVTDIERTLIDSAVRPAYSGGPSLVRDAYKNAAPRISTKRLASVLDKLDYVYPYSQVIGFYIDSCGAYDEEDVALFRRKPMKHDFYLSYGLTKHEYVKKWRLFVPPRF